MFTSILFHQNQDIWVLSQKVTFDGEEKLIIINDDITEIDIKNDLYSSWKEWMVLRDYTKFPQAMRSVGGDPTVGVDALGATFFLMNGWKIRTWEGDHELNMIGNLYSDDGSNPMVGTLFPHNILITRSVSNLIDRITISESALTEIQDQILTKVGKDSTLHTVLLLSK